MKIIKDIRVYKDRNSHIGNKQLSLSVHRMAMKLREKEFSLGDYDHLYLCFSESYPTDSVVLIDKIDRYFPWFRRVEIGVSSEELKAIETSEEPSFLFQKIEKILLTLFGGDSAKEQLIRYAIEEAAKGPQMLMFFKEKKTAKGTATVYLRLLDNAKYLPLLVVTREDGTEVLREDLPETSDLGNVGEIQLSSKKVTVKPRKNAFTGELTPVSFEISL